MIGTTLVYVPWMDDDVYDCEEVCWQMAKLYIYSKLIDGAGMTHEVQETEEEFRRQHM